MQIVDPYIQVEKVNGIQIMKNIERACRTCYRSEGKTTEESYKTLLKNCITRGHESVLEHEKVTIRLYCDLGVYKDLTRHRIASFSIESTRYCNYGKDKFDNELKVIRPCNIEEGTDIYANWKNACEAIEKNYMEMSKKGALPDQLRMILPHSIAAEVTMTANIREWKHILSLRASNHTHPSIRQLMIPLLLYFKQIMPEIFEDVPYDEEFPKEKYAKLSEIEDIY
mgnify:CR=1 FL=1